MKNGVHPQWRELDLPALLSLPTALLVIDPTNSVLSDRGAQSSDGLWQRCREPGGTLQNLVRLVASVRPFKVHVVWFRYEYLRDHFPATPMDEAQYRVRSASRAWTPEERQWDSALVEDIEVLRRPEDPEIVYQSFGNIFLGTPLPQILNAWGIRTLLLSGYHLDECVEQAARTARDLGFMPIVVGDCCSCVDPADETPTLRRIESHWAPVLTTETTIDLVARRPCS